MARFVVYGAPGGGRLLDSRAVAPSPSEFGSVMPLSWVGALYGGRVSISACEGRHTSAVSECASGPYAGDFGYKSRADAPPPAPPRSE